MGFGSFAGGVAGGTVSGMSAAKSLRGDDDFMKDLGALAKDPDLEDFLVSKYPKQEAVTRKYAGTARARKKRADDDAWAVQQVNIHQKSGNLEAANAVILSRTLERDPEKRAAVMALIQQNQKGAQAVSEAGEKFQRPVSEEPPPIITGGEGERGPITRGMQEQPGPVGYSTDDPAPQELAYQPRTEMSPELQQQRDTARDVLGRGRSKVGMGQRMAAEAAGRSGLPIPEDEDGVPGAFRPRAMKDMAAKLMSAANISRAQGNPGWRNIYQDAQNLSSAAAMVEEGERGMLSADEPLGEATDFSRGEFHRSPEWRDVPDDASHLYRGAPGAAQLSEEMGGGGPLYDLRRGTSQELAATAARTLELGRVEREREEQTRKQEGLESRARISAGPAGARVRLARKMDSRESAEERLTDLGFDLSNEKEGTPAHTKARKNLKKAIKRARKKGFIDKEQGVRFWTGRGEERKAEAKGRRRSGPSNAMVLRQAHDFLRDGQREEASRVLEGVGYTDSQVDRVFGAYDANVSASEARDRKRLGKLWTTKRVPLTEFMNFLFDEDFTNEAEDKQIAAYLADPKNMAKKEKVREIAGRYGTLSKERKKHGYTLKVTASSEWQKRMAAGD
jgi:hypothetical protein